MVVHVAAWAFSCFADQSMLSQWRASVTSAGFNFNASFANREGQAVYFMSTSASNTMSDITSIFMTRTWQDGHRGAYEKS